MIQNRVNQPQVVRKSWSRASRVYPKGLKTQNKFNGQMIEIKILKFLSSYNFVE